MNNSNRIRHAAPVSVLMATWRGDDPDHLRQALQSIKDQTVFCKEIVLVIDGPVDAGHEKIISEYKYNDSAEAIEILRLTRNMGIGKAINEGLYRCSSEYIIRMDSDDISEPYRVEKQLELMVREPNIVLAGALEADFHDDPDIIVAFKMAPEKHEEIMRALRWRCVISNPSVIFRRNAAIAIGGYRPMRIFEDHDFFMRISRLGRLHVIQEPLIRVRTSMDQRRRRGGWRVFKDLCRLRYGCFRRKDYSLAIALAGLVLWVPVIFAPNAVRNILYRIVRTPPSKPTNHFM